MINDVSSSYFFYQYRGYLNNKLSLITILYIKFVKNVITPFLVFLKINLIGKRLKGDQPGTTFLLLSPDSRSKIYFDLFLLVSYISFVLVVPLYLSFLQHYDFSDAFTLFRLVFPIIVLVFDIFMNCITAFYDKGVLIKNSKEIIKNYVFK